MADELNGGSSNNDHGDPSANGNGTPAPKAMSAEEFNKAWTAREKAAEAKQQKLIADAIKAALAAAQPAAVQQVEPATPTKESIEAATYRRQIEEMKASLETEKKARVESETKRVQGEMRKELSDLLAANGVDAKHLKHAIGFLCDVDHKVQFDKDSGEFSFDGVDLATGVSQWVKSEDAKIYLAPNGGGGSGDGGTIRRPPRVQKDPNKIDPVAMAVALQQHLAGGSSTVNIG